MTIIKITIYAYYGAQYALKTAEKDYDKNPSEETWYNLKNAKKDYIKIKDLFHNLTSYNEK